MKPSPLAALFPQEDHGFRLMLKRGDVRTFFAPSAEADAVLAERRRWLTERPADFVVDEPANALVWREVGETLGLKAATPVDLGGACEPDLVLLRRDANDRFRVRGGVVVFPTSWALPEKAGLTLAETHGVVPGLNAAIGPAIDRFLDRLKPGAAATRSNWGLAATDALNLHPALARPRLQAATPRDRVWLRVEDQILTALPASGAVLFGIRIALHALDEVLAEETARAGLHRALATMPAAIAAYKGLAEIMPALLRWTG